MKNKLILTSLLAMVVASPAFATPGTGTCDDDPSILCGTLGDGDDEANCGNPPLYYENTAYTDGTFTLEAQWTPVSCWPDVNNHPGDFITYNIGQDGVWPANPSHPTGWDYDETFLVSTPSRPGYTFAGWTISGLDSTTHLYGDVTPLTSSNGTTSTATSLDYITASYFKNLRADCGDVTFTARWTQCTAGNYSDPSGACAPCPTSHPNSIAGATAITQCYKTANPTCTGTDAAVPANCESATYNQCCSEYENAPQYKIYSDGVFVQGSTTVTGDGTTEGTASYTCTNSLATVTPNTGYHANGLQCEINEYTITYNYGNCGGNTTTYTDTSNPVQHGGTYTSQYLNNGGTPVSGMVASGKTFKYWKMNNSAYTSSSISNVTSNITLTAECTDIVNLIWDPNNGDSTETNTCYYGATTNDSNHLVVPSAFTGNNQPTKTGYEFTGWKVVSHQ